MQNQGRRAHAPKRRRAARRGLDGDELTREGVRAIAAADRGLDPGANLSLGRRIAGAADGPHTRAVINTFPCNDELNPWAVVELKLRLLAGKIPALQKYAHQKKLEDIEAELAAHFDGSLSTEEKLHAFQQETRLDIREVQKSRLTQNFPTGFCYRDLFAQRRLGLRAEPGEQVVEDRNRVLAAAEFAEHNSLADERLGDRLAQRRL